MNKKRIFVTGSGGMIGSRLIEAGCSHLVCDVTDAVQTDCQIQNTRPDVIIHLASKSGVNWCEQNQKEAKRVNVDGSMNVFSLADKYDIPVVYVSSDHIFSGRYFGKYPEKSEDFRPANYYGLLKLVVEAQAHAYSNVRIVRTSTLFSMSRPMIAHQHTSLSNGEELHSPVFLWRSFMHLNHFAESLLAYCDRIYTMPKILNISGGKTISWYGFMKTYTQSWRLDISKVHRKFQDKPAPDDAPRPYRLGLDTSLSKELGFKQYDYLDGIVSEV